MRDTHVRLAHGNGGRLMRKLIEEIFAHHLGNPLLDVGADAVALPRIAGETMVTTDGFTVTPLEFPGGNLGSLAVHGTVNDLAVAGARPLYLTLNAFIEEGLELAQLERIVAAVAQAAHEAGVNVVAGDTKVLPRGEGGGLYLAVTGVGERAAGRRLHLGEIESGDVILVSGPVGDHGTAVMLAREQFGLRGDLQSDAASVLPLTEAIWHLPGLRFMRDPTRGGLATVAHEMARGSGVTIRLQSAHIPVREPVRVVCDMLGYDPLFLACEGRVVAVIAASAADEALRAWRALPQGAQACRIGRVQAGPAQVVVETEFGGERLLPELEEDPLPRIC
jgi:hydrogenase expression/formation protein HypE